MRIAERIQRLGTETAFAVSAEAAAFAAQGNTVYPFHLGDMNLPTPDNVMDAAARAMRDGRTGYTPNAGIPKLREALAADINAARGTAYATENVAIQPGGKPVIGKFMQALMNPGDEVLYPNPGYPIYESQIEYFGGVAVPYGYVETADGFALDLDGIRRAITPRTRLLVLNDPANPTGSDCSQAEIERVAELCLQHDIYVLSDEAYFDIRYEGPSLSITSLPDMADRTVILYTFSKKFAATGWRLGAAIGPRPVIDVIAKLNVNAESCSNHFVQYAMLEGLTGDQSGPLAILRTLRERRDAAASILNTMPGIRCFAPRTTFYLWPDVTEAMQRKGFSSLEDFRKAVLHETHCSVCGRHHFGRPGPNETRHYVRLAYSGIGLEAIREGLGRFKSWLEH